MPAAKQVCNTGTSILEEDDATISNEVLRFFSFELMKNGNPEAMDRLTTSYVLPICDELLEFKRNVLMSVRHHWSFMSIVELADLPVGSFPLAREPRFMFLLNARCLEQQCFKIAL